MSVALLCLAVVLSSAELKPVKWREWANLQEHENPKSLLLNHLANDSASNILEHRPGFLDIRAKRKAYLTNKSSEKKNVVKGQL